MPTHTGSMPNTDSIRVPRWVSGEGRAIFCPKHCYGPMDCWYDCQECVDENTDAPKNPCHIPCNEKRKATDAAMDDAYSERNGGILSRFCTTGNGQMRIPRERSWTY